MSSAIAAPPVSARRSGGGKGAAADPVTQYARDIVAGRILAGRAVRLQCQRHLDDLARQRSSAFLYMFDLEAAQRIIDFFPAFLTLEDGRPFVLPPWLQFCYGSIYGWKCWGGAKAEKLHRAYRQLKAEYDALDRDQFSVAQLAGAARQIQAAEDRWRAADLWTSTAGHARHGLRRFVHGYLETSKGSGKTPSAGGIALFGAGFDGEEYGEIYSTGFDKGQASIILNDAIRMGEQSPDDEFRAQFVIDKYNIAHVASGSFVRASSSQHRSKSGPRPSYVLSDEIHEHRDGTVVTKMEAGFKNRLQPLGLKYTNSGASKVSFCWQLHQKALDVLEGTIVDEQWFAYVCHLDPCAACYAEGYRQPKDGCKHCDDWTDPKVWPKIAPALGIVIQPKYLQDQIDKARSIPSEYSLIRRLNFCLWTETHQIWIPSEQWDACRSDQVVDKNPEARPATAGLDLSSKIDLSALVVAVRFDDPPGARAVETVAIEGMNEEGQRAELKFTLNFSVELIPFFWIPEETMLARVNTEHIPYDVWHRGKYLTATPGPVIDHEAIYQDIVKQIWPRFKVQRLGYDERDATMLAVKLRDQARLGDKIIALGQGKKLSEAFKLIEVLVRSRRLRHNGHPVLAWNFANAEPHTDRLNARWIEKPSDTKRIDGAVAAAMAIHQLMVLPPRRPKSGGVFFV